MKVIYRMFKFKINEINFLILAFFSIFIFLTNLANAQENEIKIKATLMMYSGEPNPFWFIKNPEDFAQIKDHMQNLHIIEPEREPVSGAIALNNESSLDFPEVVLIFSDIIYTREFDQTEKWFKDESQNLRRFLIEKARTELGSEADIFEDGFETDAQ